MIVHMHVNTYLCMQNIPNLWVPEKERLAVTLQENQVFIPVSPVDSVTLAITHAVQL